jgi:predicted TIM-barrel fold metal-dependent hydrolase
VKTPIFSTPRIVDFHTHVWPDNVAGKAVATITEFPVRGGGTVADLVADQEAAGVDLSVCLFFALRAERVESVNEFAGSLDRSHFIPFGTIHPDLTPEENLASLKSSDVRGIKVHPTFQQYTLDDPRVLDVLEAVAGTYPVVFHVGAGAGGDGSGATPRMIRDIARALPTLKVIAAHFGGYRFTKESLVELVGTSVYLDTSWPPSLAALDPDTVRSIINRHGSNRILFGSDWPTASPADEIAALRNLDLPEEDVVAILGGNAVELLQL